MERLEQKKINGHTYYYYSKWEWKNGRCRRVWQKYMGKLQDIANAVQNGQPQPQYAEVFQWGLPTALWNECNNADIINITDNLCSKRRQGITTGEYLVIAAINRAISPKSKRSMWEWFSQTILLKKLIRASQAGLSSQRFWDHMDRINGDKPSEIWKTILKRVICKEEIDLSSISYDGTNFYTFIDTFNTKCKMAKRGKNKQGRNNLRQISYALFCCADSHMPLFYDIYDGNRSDAKQFPLMLKKFHAFLNEIRQENQIQPRGLYNGNTNQPQTQTQIKFNLPLPKITLIFDKGNNSTENFAVIDSQNLNYVGSVKLDEHKELARISNNDERFKPCEEEEFKLEGTKSFRIKKIVYGKERVLVVTYNQNLFNSQFLTVQNDMTKATEKLSLLYQRLEDWANGLMKRGRPPTKQTVENQCAKILSRQYMKDVIRITVSVPGSATKNPKKIPRLEYFIDSDAIAELCDTHLGKNIIITNHQDWNDSRIIKAYRSQFIIENVFKEMKDRKTGSWWPLHHWTDSKIKVHSLYCTLALLIRALMYRRIIKKGLKLSMTRLLNELDAIREVINIYKAKRRRKKQTEQSVLTKTSEVQKKIMDILNMQVEKS